MLTFVHAEPFLIDNRASALISLLELLNKGGALRDDAYEGSMS